MPWLAIHISGEYSRREIKRALMAGNAPSDAIILAAESALRHHFKIDSDAGGWYIEDLHGTELVRVNGIPTLRRYLTNGDEICVDDDAIVFHNDDPDPRILLAEPEGVIPGAPDDIPATGPFMERVIINLAYENQRRWIAWSWFSVISLALSLAFLVYAVVAAISFIEPASVVSSTQALITDAYKSAEAGNYRDAIKAARLALKDELSPATRSALNASIVAWVNDKARRENAAAARITDRMRLVREFPGTTPAFTAISSLCDEQIGQLYENYEHAREEWQKAQKDVYDLSARGAYSLAAAVFEEFVCNYPNSPYSGMAAIKAQEYTRKSRMASTDFYYRSRTPRLLSFDLHSPQSILDWRADSGEWARSDRGLKLESPDGPQGLILYEKHEYCGASLWMRLCCTKPREGILWAGLWHEDSTSLRFEISPNSSCIKIATRHSKFFKDFALPKGDVIQIEMAIYKGNLLIVHGESETRVSGLDMAGQVTGWPALGASAAGAEFIGFEIGW